jgi:hypothetical protein
MHGVSGGVSKKDTVAWAFRRAKSHAYFESIHAEETVQPLYGVEVG